MSFPPPPGFQQQPPSRPPSSQPKSYASLPPRPPSASYSSTGAPGTSGKGYNATSNAPKTGTGYNAFTAFQPRAVTANQPYRPHSPAVSAPPTTAAYQYPQHGQYNAQQYGQPNIAHYGQQTPGAYGQPGAPQIQNPFPVPGQTPINPYGAGSRGYSRPGEQGLDPETEAQIAQWQSAYMGKDSEAAQTPGATGRGGAGGRRDGAFAATGANTGPLGAVQRMHDSAASTPSSGPQTTSSTPVPGGPNTPTDPSAPTKTVLRSGGGQTWTDPTLLEWDPAHFRLFAGNLAGEVTDDSLLKAFSKYPSVQKARVIRDKRTEKSKGYGFVSFSDGEDYFRAAREMQGKYIGSHPVLLRRAMTEIRPVTAGKGGAGGKGGKKGGGGGGGGSGSGGGKGGGKVIEGGIQKKHGKTKGGLRVLG
ncbi:hypothetical protein FQN52_007883 [Onygenales sp. PD_12]|nr:hypothetical protein FQN52_007883 [Onygenales sp. PD_12]